MKAILTLASVVLLSAILIVAAVRGIEAPAEATNVSQQTSSAIVHLPVEGELPSLEGALDWINSKPLTPANLRGKVVLVDFWTYTCVNWSRTLPYVRAWSEKYKNDGLTVIGVHTPEFSFEKNIDNIRRAIKEMTIPYPVAVDSNYTIWNAFNNQYWPAVYLVDAQGRIRYHHFGEGAYDEQERAIQQLLVEAGRNVPHGLVSVDPRGLEVSADNDTLQSGETYTGYSRTEGFASPGGYALNKAHVYVVPMQMKLNTWALSGDWNFGKEAVLLNKGNGRIAYRFHARDVNLIMGPATRGTTVRFRVLIDGKPPGDAHGDDADALGHGTVSEQRTYQLIRQRQPIVDRTFEIEFLDPNVEAYDFTFG